jgi:hypothetical protein
MALFRLVSNPTPPTSSSSSLLVVVSCSKSNLQEVFSGARAEGWWAGGGFWGR